MIETIVFIAIVGLAVFGLFRQLTGFSKFVELPNLDKFILVASGITVFAGVNTLLRWLDSAGHEWIRYTVISVLIIVVIATARK